MANGKGLRAFATKSMWYGLSTLPTRSALLLEMTTNLIFALASFLFSLSISFAVSNLFQASRVLSKSEKTAFIPISFNLRGSKL